MNIVDKYGFILEESTQDTYYKCYVLELGNYIFTCVYRGRGSVTYSIINKISGLSQIYDYLIDFTNMIDRAIIDNRDNNINTILNG